MKDKSMPKSEPKSAKTEKGRAKMTNVGPLKGDLTKGRESPEPGSADE